MHSRKMIGAATMAVASLGIALAASTGTGAASTPHVAQASSAGIEHVTIVQVGHKEKAVVHGVFTGGGRDDSHGQRDVLHLGGGTITVKHPNKQSTFTPHVNHTTCYVKYTVAGKYSITNGTGRFAGVSGHGKYLAHGEGILPRTSSGACSKRGEPKPQLFVVKAKGPASTG